MCLFIVFTLMVFYFFLQVVCVWAVAGSFEIALSRKKWQSRDSVTRTHACIKVHFASAKLNTRLYLKCAHVSVCSGEAQRRALCRH